jgi:hypothetical protein
MDKIINNNNTQTINNYNQTNNFNINLPFQYNINFPILNQNISLNSKSTNNNIINNFNFNYNSLAFSDYSNINSILDNINSENSKDKNLKKSCNFIKQKIFSNHDFANNVLYPNLRTKLLSLINNKYFNFIFQNLLEIFNQENLIDFTIFLSNNFDVIAISQNGTKLLQKLIEIQVKKNNFLNNNNKFIYNFFKQNLQGKITKFSKEENANHIIQKFIIYIPFPYNNFICEEIYVNFLEISVTKYGCCVIQKLLINGNKFQKQKIIFLILSNTFNLITNQFGNYIYQSILLLNNDYINKIVVEILYKNLILFCKEKYSSNVIEKLFIIKNKYLISIVCDKISENVLELIFNIYGNYVIQKMIFNVNDKNIHIKIGKIIYNNFEEIINLSYGKKFINNIANKNAIIREIIQNKLK